MKAAIDRRSATVADYVESYLGSEERERFLEVVATKVRLMVEIREIQEKVGGIIFATILIKICSFFIFYSNPF